MCVPNSTPLSTVKCISIIFLFLFLFVQCSSSKVYHIDINGNDVSGDGSKSRPWRTLLFALSKVPANEGHTILLSAGIFVEKGYLNVPLGVNIEGSGSGTTIIKPDSSLYFQSPQWIFDKFLISLISEKSTTGNQSLKNFAIDGESKKLYGGIYVRDRNNITIQNIKVQNTFLTGIWIWGSNDSRVSEIELKDCAYASDAGASGAIQFTGCERLEVDQCTIDETMGNGVDFIGGGKMYDLKFHDNHITVIPTGTYKTPSGDTLSNFAVEFYNVELRGCEIYNNYFDNTLSLAMDEPKFATSTGQQTVRVYNNVFDIITRAKGRGYGLELTLHDAEIDHNYFYGGSTGIVNWDASKDPHTMQNWKIHHNVFFNIESFYPSAIIGFYRHGIINADIYNNTVELVGNSTIHFLEVNNGGVAKNVKVNNNLIINSNTSYKWFPHRFLSAINNASFQNSSASNNYTVNMSMDSIAGVLFKGNLSGDPLIVKSGDRPRPYYELTEGSPLIDAGTPLSSEYKGKGIDIGAYEFGDSD